MPELARSNTKELRETYADRYTIFYRHKDAVEALEERGFFETERGPFVHYITGKRAFLTPLNTSTAQYLVTWGEFEPQPVGKQGARK